jgi:predicted acyl esterase
MTKFGIRWTLWILCIAVWGFGTLEVVAAEQTIPDQVIEIPMRDGTKLPANVFLPHGSSKTKFPCALVRNPLGKESLDPAWFRLVESGYVLVVQSTRSCCDETGKTIPYVADGWSEEHRLADGYDTVQWLAAADFCNGTVSTIGASATAITEMLLAPAAPPNLCCQYIEMAPPSMYQYAIYPGGQFRKEQVEGWLQIHRRHPSVISWIRTKSCYDAFWGHFNSLDYADQVRVPQVHVGGWFDIFLQGTIDAFSAVQQHSQSEVRQKHRLIIGPWGHRWRASSKLGDFLLKEDQLVPPVNISQMSWLDYHVKGEKNGVEKAPAVQYYVMGPFDGSPSKGNCWKCADTWPPAGAEYTNFFIGSDSQLVSNEIDVEPAAVLFDVKQPVPSIGGRNLFIPDGPKDVQELAKRKDVLFYSSKTLEEDVEVTGRIWANTYVSLDKERDVCVRLVDIWPTGQQFLVSEGVSHVVPRSAADAKVSGPKLVIVDLWTTSMVFAKGHKIGIMISASNYPAFDTAFAANEEQGTAFSLHSTKKTPSLIALPVMKSTQTIEQRPEVSPA